MPVAFISSTSVFTFVTIKDKFPGLKIRKHNKKTFFVITHQKKMLQVLKKKHLNDTDL